MLEVFACVRMDGFPGRYRTCIPKVRVSYKNHSSQMGHLSGDVAIVKVFFLKRARKQLF